MAARRLVGGLNLQIVVRCNFWSLKKKIRKNKQNLVTSPIYRTHSFMERAPPEALLTLNALANAEF